MRYYTPISKMSSRGRLCKDLDKLLSGILAIERGPNCEIHNRVCDRVGNMHILSKQAHPRLRYERENIIRAGWFCSHFWTHHNPDDVRAIYVKKRIIELRGTEWRERLLTIEKFKDRHDILYLRLLYMSFKSELETLCQSAKKN